MAENFCLSIAHDIRQCPGCQSFCERVDSSKNRAHCWRCTLENKSPYRFCWHCLHEWQSTDESVICGNDSCNRGLGPVLKQLQEAEDMEIGSSKCPQYRVCPKCGTLCGHRGGCKQMVCASENCKREFCFVCLHSRGSCVDRCEPAARQTEIPQLRKH